MLSNIIARNWAKVQVNKAQGLYDSYSTVASVSHVLCGRFKWYIYTIWRVFYCKNYKNNSIVFRFSDV